ncbi:MAG TPA: tRNA epoxyqueuosine(34) reductase QueG, partial [Solibacterales bacterium]|nr:tRNA epoxyqueuosine(34) reductase QueG [Bryobacterales bacterium]
APAGYPSPWTLDSNLCISYLTIELRGAIPEPLRPGNRDLVFGCDICQDVCPWNRRAPISLEPAFAPRDAAHLPLERLAALSPQDFRACFRDTPVWRARYSGFLRNVAVAMGTTRRPGFRPHLQRLAASPDETVAEHAQWALAQLPSTMEGDG